MKEDFFFFLPSCFINSLHQLTFVVNLMAWEYSNTEVENKEHSVVNMMASIKLSGRQMRKKKVSVCIRRQKPKWMKRTNQLMKVKADFFPPLPFCVFICFLVPSLLVSLFLPPPVCFPTSLSLQYREYLYLYCIMWIVVKKRKVNGESRNTSSNKCLLHVATKFTFGQSLS